MTSQKKVVVDEKKRSHLRTREVMDFDPSPIVLHSQEDVIDFLKKHHVILPVSIVVEWCHPVTDVKVHPPEGGVYFHPQVLALGVHLPLTVFIR